jgi:hypothetical protein
MTETPGARQNWPHKHSVLTTLGTVSVAIILIAAIFGTNSSKTTTVTASTTVTQTVTTRSGRRHARTIIRRAPAPPPRTVTATPTATTTVSAAAAPATPAVEGPGSTSHATDSQFCSTHACIPNFPNGSGTIVQCADGDWSHSGGLSGACSDHGGEA